MDLSNFSEIYKTDNIFGVLALFIVGVIALVWNKWSSIEKLFRKKPQRKKVKLISTLINHSIFYKFGDIFREVKSMKFTTHGEFDEVKTKLLHKLIEIQLTTIENTLITFITDDRNQDLSENEMEAKVMSMNNNVLKAYNLKAKNIFINEYAILEKDADLMIDSYANFRAQFHRSFENQMAIITRNNDYEDNYIKASALLEVVSTSLYSIPAYGLMAMNEVNGTFLKYKN